MTAWQLQEKEWLSARKPPPLPKSLPLDINEEQFDAESGEFYYVNRFWRTSTWTKPQGFVYRYKKRD